MSNVADDILSRIVTRLRTITTVNLYGNTLAIFEEEQEPASPRDKDVVVLKGDTIQQEKAPCGFDEFLLPVGIVAYAIQSEQATTPIRTPLSSYAADIRKSLGVEQLDEGRQFINIEWPEPDQYFTEAAPASVQLVPHFRYRTLRNNPNAQS